MTLTTLNFLSDLPIYKTEQPYELYGFPEQTSELQTNCRFDNVKDVVIHDVRDRMDEFTLDGAGFTFIRHTSQCELKAEHFETAPEGNDVVTAYLEETMNLVKGYLGADHIVCFDWRFRRNTPVAEVKIPPKNVNLVRFQALPVGATMHCDFSYNGGKDRLGMHLLNEELKAINATDYDAVLVNAWRPIRVVKNAPLVLCDRRSVRKQELIEVDKVLPDKVEKAFFINYNQHQMWHYLSEQAPDEVTLFVSWRPEQNGDMAEYSPHGASSAEAGGTTPRESVEVRLIVFIPKHI